MQDHRDTIFALSSGLPPAAIAVVRISGPRTAEALTLLTGRVPPPRRAALARIRDPRSGEMIDEALALWFPAPNSETGEDVAELQVHGGRAVVAAVLAALGRIDGLRLAEGGEFTRRGFENGKLDLTAVEGLGDLIAAETETQRRQAFRQMKGLLGDRAEAWRTRLIEALALIEARIDFSDEADVPEDLVGPALAIVRTLRQEVAATLADAGRGERLRDGVVVAIAGPPNAGKSTLLNRLAQREAAIVSPYAGTTRDVIEVHLDLGGYPVTLLDTAGIRRSDDPVEQEGVRRARARAAAADLVLWLEEAASTQEQYSQKEGPEKEIALSGRTDNAGLSTTDAPQTAYASQTADASQTAGALQAVLPGREGPGVDEFNFILSVSENKVHTPQVWKLRTKIDVLNQRISVSDHAGRNDESEFLISAKTGFGIQPLEDELSRFVRDTLQGGEPALVTRQRHRTLLEAVAAALDRALAASAEEAIAEELRTAATALGRLTGRIDVEDVLDVIFRDFCIGK